MQNNIPTLYILKLDTFVVKSAKISTILCLFVQKIKNVDRIAMVTVTQQCEPAFSHRITMRPEGYVESEPLKFVSARISHYACWPPFS